MESKDFLELKKKISKKINLKKKKGEVCVYCGCTNRLCLTIDHKIPLIRGGRDEDNNKQVCCYLDNQLKGGLTHVEYKKYLKCLYTLKELGKLSVKLQPPLVVFKDKNYPFFTDEDEKQDVGGKTV